MEWLATLTHPIRLYQDSTLTVSFVLSSIIYLTICFVLLGVTASDYLCPNVASVAEPGTLRSVDVGTASSGALVAILLSWCNSAPDLLSNLLSWTSTSTGTVANTSASASAAAALSVGEVIGSCGMILCIVQGAIFMLMGTTNDPIRLNKRQRIDMLRDTAFVLVAMLLLTYVSIRNRVSVMNCLVMVLWYGIYIFTKFKQQSRFGTNNASDELTNFGGDNNNNDGNSDEINNNFTILPETVIKPSIIEAMDYTTLLNLLEHSSNENDDDDDNTIGQEFIEVRDHGVGIPSFPLVLLNQTDGTGNVLVQGTRHTPHSAPVANREFGTTYSDTRQIFSSPASVPFAPYSDDPESVSRSEVDPGNVLGLGLDQPFITTVRERIKLGKVLIKMFVPHMANYKHKSVPDWILSMATAPFVILLQISCPKPIRAPLDYEGNSPKYNYTKLNLCLLMAQSLLAPTITLLLISCLHQNTKLYFNWLLPIELTVVSVPMLATLVYLLRAIHRYNRFSLPRHLSDETDNAKQETRRHIESATTIIKMAFPILGIINSILYISLIANALVETLQLYQQLTEVSESILGLTVFAWGNSISDLISNVAMCRLYRRLPARRGRSSSDGDSTFLASKFFVIACSSCIGGVMLNSMAGIGLSGLVAMLFVHGGSSGFVEWWFLRYTDLHETLAIDYKFVVSCFGLGVVVLVMAVSYGLGGHYFKWIDEQRWAFGVFMCGVWGVVTLCNVCLETF